MKKLMLTCAMLGSLNFAASEQPPARESSDLDKLFVTLTPIEQFALKSLRATDKSLVIVQIEATEYRRETDGRITVNGVPLHEFVNNGSRQPAKKASGCAVQ